MLRVSNRQAVTPIAQRQEFKNHSDSMGGTWASGHGSGRLNDEWSQRYHEENPAYVVYSYATPIAWWSEQHGWTVVEQKFSTTTSKHQHVVRMAVY